MFVPQTPTAAVENGHTNGSNHGAKPKVVYDETGKNQYSTKDLDVAIKEVTTLARDQVVNGWNLGKKVGEIYDKGLWKTRGTYQSFDDFAKAELPLAPVTALRWMNIARKFTEEETRDKPVEMLRELATLNDTDAKALLRSYETNESTAGDVRKKAKELKKAKKGDAGPKKKAGVAEANMARTNTEERTTLQIPSAKKHYTMNAKSVKGEEQRAAKSIEDQPWVQIPCQRGVYLQAQVTIAKDGTIRLTVQPIRAGG